MPTRLPHVEAVTRSTRDPVRAYWDRVHDLYLGHVGTTFQAGRIAGESVRASNLWLARAAGLETGQRVLDAGCGVCGPSIDIALQIVGLRIVGITLSGRQAATAASLVASAGLADRVQVVHGDYHQLPFADATFDAVVFLESLGYARSLVKLFEDVHRVLRAGGALYIKDVFRREQLWSDRETQELAEFDRVYAHRTPTISACAAAAADAGFRLLATRDLSSVISTADARRAMFDEAGDESLSAFGRLHYCRHSCLPVYFAELTARARMT